MSSEVLTLDDAADGPDWVGTRAAMLSAARAAGMPVPPGLVLSPAAAAGIAEGGPAPRLPGDVGPYLAVRATTADRSAGCPASFLNLGITDATLGALAARIGAEGALEAYRRLIRDYGVRVAGIDPEAFENLYYDQIKLTETLGEAELKALVATSLSLYQDETDENFPQTLGAQLRGAISALRTDWNAPTARILRTAQGGSDVEMSLLLQRMVWGLGEGSGVGTFQLVDSASGKSWPNGRWLPSAQGSDAGRGARTPHMATIAARERAGQTRAALEESDPDVFATLSETAHLAITVARDAVALEFTLEQGTLWVLEVEPVKRSARAAVRLAVDLAEAEVISRDTALLRVEPRNLTETLHPQIDPDAPRDVFGRGLPASPGAATGMIHFRSTDAMAAAAQGEAVILVRPETSPEDIRGMHSAAGVLTVRGGMTSHAAVIARGLGLPCVVGASELSLDLNARELRALDGRVFRAGDVITLDGTKGEAMAGALPMLPAVQSAAFDTLLGWADARRSLGVRANADTPADAQVARRFQVDGIGLCRTEHMFFEENRITVMRQMILADSEADRIAALDRLLPMQRADFEELFEIMAGLPVTIRLLDPPLHEFLPHGAEEMQALAEAMDLPVAKVMARAADLAEFNPMLGKRGVRLGVTMPEIYDMQARAIFEAALAVTQRMGAEVTPEIMIPLVSANREAELVKARVDAVAAGVQAEMQARLKYRIGVMVETPRGALRAGDLARHSAFLSFGTNDLTQMTYGLSRDDAGRFMQDYVSKGVFPEDPFHSLDLEGVGELLLLAAKRGRAISPDLMLGLCGEHGGDPSSIRFCKLAGFDYVSCSPFRVPIARLAAAQADILTTENTG